MKRCLISGIIGAVLMFFVLQGIYMIALKEGEKPDMEGKVPYGEEENQTR